MTDAPKRTAKQWGLPLRPPAKKRKDSGELVIEDAKPADPSHSPVIRAEAVRIVMPALQLPAPVREPDSEVIAGELDNDLESLQTVPRFSYAIILAGLLVVVVTTWLLLAW